MRHNQCRQFTFVSIANATRSSVLPGGAASPASGLPGPGFTVATKSPHFSTSYAAALVLIETLVTMVVREAGRGGVDGFTSVKTGMSPRCAMCGSSISCDSARTLSSAHAAPRTVIPHL